MEHYRPVWRKVARATDERSAIAAIASPETVCKDSAYTVRGGSIDSRSAVALVAAISSFCFDYLVRFAGRSNLTYVAMNPTPVPSLGDLQAVIEPAALVISQSAPCRELFNELLGGTSAPLDAWGLAEQRAAIDAHVAKAYRLTLEQYAAVLSSFPNIDRAQPMLAGEPKCFVTRDIALRAFCDATGTEKPDVAKLMREIGSGLPDPHPEKHDLDERLKAYKEMGAIPYRPTPRGARLPTDPSVLEDVLATLSGDPLSSAEVADLLGEDEDLVATILKNAQKTGGVYVEGRGKNARYYVVGED